jgi:tetrapyrrole methylase family protein / MazG family protein
VTEREGPSGPRQSGVPGPSGPRQSGVPVPVPSRVVVVGLGPGAEEFVNQATRDAIAATPRRFVRTGRHPSAVIVSGAESFDCEYERAADLDAVYRAIVERLVEAARREGCVLYAVPGSPVVAERTVELLAGDERVTVEIVPSMSFLDLAWARLRIDPIARGVSVIDGQRFAEESIGRTGAMLVAQCDSRDVLSQIKLAYDEAPCDEVTVLARLGTTDECIFSTTWSELDRSFEPDHLTSLYFEPRRANDAGAFVEFDELVRTLRARCPWDREQTHESLRRHLIEECYEVLDALDAVAAGEDASAGYAHLEEELGDLMFQVFFHSVIASEQGQFGVADVVRGIDAKLRSRHPHVFGDVVAGSSDEVVANWEQIKKIEKNRASVMDGIPRSLPALLYALKVQKKAESAGYAEPQRVGAPSGSDDEVADLLLDAVALARARDIDPEDALRRAADAYRARFQQFERASM